MARPSGEKNRCSGRWTQAKFNSFIKGNLRRATLKWAPINECQTAARVARGLYECAECKEHVPATYKEGRVRKKNVHVDHIVPIVDPAVGFTTWDDCIERMFCERDNLQLLCTKCHNIKCQEEKDIATARRRMEKQLED